MNKLSEEKEKAIRLDVFTQWLNTYQKQHKKNPSFQEIVEYSAELNSRQAPKSPEALIDLQREEDKIRRYARVIMTRLLIREKDKNGYPRIRIDLMLEAGCKTIVKGGHPSVIQLGFTSKEPNFRADLIRLIQRADKAWEPSSLILGSKVFEYKKDNKKFVKFKEDPNYYPLVPEDRIRVEVTELIRVVDMRTGDYKTRSRTVEKGHYKHLKNNPLVEEARLDLSRHLYANGKLTDDDLTYEKEETPAKDTNISG